MLSDTASFVHLHLHTQYSLLDGAIRMKDLMQKAKAYAMPAVAMTDHGNLFGAIEFYQAAKSAGVKPIIGCEVYLAPGSMLEKKSSSAKEAASHLTLLCKDNEGYRNLTKLVSAAWLEGYYYKPRIDKELLAQHAKGLICLSGCLKGEINGYILADQEDKARETIAQFRDIFAPGDFYLELHDHGLEAQAKCNRALCAFAKEFDLPLVAANDVHFLERAHHEAHDVMICIGTGSQVHDEKRMRYAPELYFKSPQEMAELFAEVPEAISNTLRIAEQCEVQIEFGESKFPAYYPPEGKSREGYLLELCEEGLQKRYGDRLANEPELRARMDYELGVINKGGFTSYFLIVWDFIHYARSLGIPVGPGRGSAAGVMVSYLLEITDIDPLRFGLIFERFLNPERVSPPDIDIDFCMERRGEVIQYVRDKYGERKVGQIVTFGTLSSRAVLKDVCRVLGMSYSEGDRLSKMIPLEGARPLNLEAAAEKNPELKQAIETEPATRQVWDYALTLEGLTRGTGVHAAGVVIGEQDLSDYIPLARDKEGQVISQFTGNQLNDLGLLKMDFLGLKTLTVIQESLNLIHQHSPEFSLEKIAFDDPKTIDLLNRGETVGVFQLESGGMTSMCKQFDVQSIDDILAISALYRPGPMDLIPDYIRRKKGQTKVKYEHPLLKEISEDTYGILIYQEQVQRAANVLAGYTLGQADLLRRAMGKKDKEKMAKERSVFIEGCKRVNNIDEKKANAIFDILEKFAGYGFNKSHSAAYGLITYRTAFLKANYPLEFMAAILSNAINDTDKIAVFVTECQRMGIEILPPDVNKSQLKFAPEKSAEAEGARRIRFGLAAIKNVGEAAMAEAIKERTANGEFASFEDFCKRLDTRTVNKKILESLVKSGAFDFVKRERAELFFQIDHAIASAASRHRDRASGQFSMFEDFDSAPAPQHSSAELSTMAWTVTERLAFEKELLGFYVTGHPLNPYREILNQTKWTPIEKLKEQENKTTVRAAGRLAEVNKKFTKKDGKPFAVIVLEDLTGSVEAVLWNDVYNKCAAWIETGKMVSIQARVEQREEETRVLIQEVAQLKLPKNFDLKEPKSVPIEPLRLHFALGQTQLADLDHVQKVLAKFPGRQPVEFVFQGDPSHGNAAVSIRPNPKYQVQLGEEAKNQLAPWLKKAA